MDTKNPMLSEESTGLAPEVIAIGCIAADLSVLGAPPEIEAGYTTFVDSIHPGLGGNPSNMASGLAKFGRRVAVAGKVGDDELGRMILARLRACGVDTRLLQSDGATQTSTTIAIIHESGQRNLYHYRGANTEIGEESLRPVLAVPARLFFAGGIELLPRLRGEPIGNLLRAARQAGKVTVLDTTFDPDGEWLPAIAPALPHVDYLLASMGEAAHYAGTSSPSEVIRFFRAAGARTVLVKDGAEGCFLQEGSGFLQIHPPQVTVLDTTGAGDNFAAGFIAGLLEELTLPDCVRLGVTCGSLSTEARGGEARYHDIGLLREMAAQLAVTRFREES